MENFIPSISLPLPPHFQSIYKHLIALWGRWLQPKAKQWRTIVSQGVRIWKCYEFLPNQCFANIPKVTRVNVPLTVLIVYRVPLWYKKTNQVSVFCMSHSSCAKSCSNVLEVVELTLSWCLKYAEPWVQRGRGSWCRSSKSAVASGGWRCRGCGRGSAAERGDGLRCSPAEASMKVLL